MSGQTDNKPTPMSYANALQGKAKEPEKPPSTPPRPILTRRTPAAPKKQRSPKWGRFSDDESEGEWVQGENLASRLGSGPPQSTRYLSVHPEDVGRYSF